MVVVVVAVAVVVVVAVAVAVVAVAVDIVHCPPRHLRCPALAALGWGSDGGRW